MAAMLTQSMLVPSAVRCRVFPAPPSADLLPTYVIPFDQGAPRTRSSTFRTAELADRAGSPVGGPHHWQSFQQLD
jgi:hypothetical protein